MKVMVIVGTRPEVIKMAPVVERLKKSQMDTLVCSTGQHREMLTQALDVFSIRPDINLDVMKTGQSLNQLSGRLLAELDEVLEREKPDWVLVQGDTTTALCGGMAAFHKGIKIGHIEAGLRTGDLASPFPEEANRSLLSRIATRHFAPTQKSYQMLLKENISPKVIDITGNTVVDALEMVRARIMDISLEEHKNKYGIADDKPLIMVTCHRRENFGGTLEEICRLLSRLATQYPNYQWVFPVHLNPRVQEPVRRILDGHENLLLLPPLDYLTNLSLISRAELVVSDSGGIQEEAPSFGVPVVVMRSHTEREEGIKAGFASLAGQSASRIEAAVNKWLENNENRTALKMKNNPYGDGQASDRIIARLMGKDVEAFHV